MSKLDELRQFVADAFKEAEDKQSIEQYATMNKMIEEAQSEEQSLLNKNAELIKSYRDLVHHTSFSDPSKKPVDGLGGTGVSFEQALQEFMLKK